MKVLKDQVTKVRSKGGVDKENIPIAQRGALLLGEAGRRTGKVTHIGTTTTIGNVSVFSPSAEVSGTLSNSPLPAPAFSQVATVQRSSVGATPVASVQLPTAAGLVHGQIGIQIGGVRRIR
eukprot:g17660.t1